MTPMVLNIVVMFYKAKKLRTTVASGTVGNIEMGGGLDHEVRSSDIRGIVTVALLLGSVVGLTYVTVGHSDLPADSPGFGHN